MRVALIADIHGNLAALDAVVSVLERQRPDQVICLGDVAATGPQPHEILQRLRALGWPVVMGNTDAGLLAPDEDGAGLDDDGRRIAEIDKWGAAQLDDADRAFIASFRPTIEIPLGDAGRLLCCHGSPRSFNDVIIATTPDDALDAMLAGIDVTVVAGGHTHVRLLRAHRGLEIVNPGSIGLAYEFFADGSVRVPPWAEFAFLDVQEGALSVDFRREPYDRDATVRAMFERHMPHAKWWAADWR